MKTYRPGSWSEIAREIANKQIEDYFYFTKEYVPSEVVLNDKEWIEEITNINSYLEILRNLNRAEIIKRRAIKRFVRIMKKKKVL